MRERQGPYLVVPFAVSRILGAIAFGIAWPTASPQQRAYVLELGWLSLFLALASLGDGAVTSLFLVGESFRSLGFCPYGLPEAPLLLGKLGGLFGFMLNCANFSFSTLLISLLRSAGDGAAAAAKLVSCTASSAPDPVLCRLALSAMAAKLLLLRYDGGFAEVVGFS